MSKEENRRAVRKVIAEMKFQVGSLIDDVRITSTNQGKRTTRRGDKNFGREVGPITIFNMREFSEQLRMRFYKPWNYRRRGLEYTVTVKPIQDGFNVEVHWPSLPSDVVVSANYYPWVMFGGKKGKNKPLTDKNLKELIGLVKKWNMSRHWYYES